MRHLGGRIRKWKHTARTQTGYQTWDFLDLCVPMLPGLHVIPPSVQPSHTLPPGALAPRVCACLCVCVYIYMCARECLSPQRYCTLQCRATLCSLDVLCLYSHWSLWMKTPLLGLFLELVYPPVLAFSPPRPSNDALYTTYIPVTAGALPLIFFFHPAGIN